MPSDINVPLNDKSRSNRLKTPFDYLWDMKPGQKYEIKTEKQRQICYDFVELFGFDFGYSITSDRKYIKKYHFINRPAWLD